MGKESQRRSDMKDLLILDSTEGSIVFSAGSGALTSNADKSSGVVRALSLFAQYVLHEPVQFVRFQNHRMIFLPGSEYMAVSLVSVDVNPRQIIPIIRLTLWLVESYADYLGMSSNYNQMIAFYRALAEPSKAAFIFPRTPEGLLDLLTLVTILIHDLRYGINEVVSNVHFVDSEGEIPTILSSVNPEVIFAFLPETEFIRSLGVAYCCVSAESPEESVFYVSPEEKSFMKISSLFGALGYKYGDHVAKILDTEDAFELAREVMSLPRSRDDVLYRAIIEATMNPRKDILTTLTQVVVEALEELRAEKSVAEELKPISFEEPTEAKEKEMPTAMPQPAEPVTPSVGQISDLELPDLSSLEESPASDTTSSAPPSVSIPTVEESASTSSEVISSEPIPSEVSPPPSQVPLVSEDILGKISDSQKSKLEKAIADGWLYRFDSIPLIVDFSPYHSGVAPPPSYREPYQDDDEKKLILQILPPDAGKITVRFFLPTQRIRSALSSLESLTDVHDAQISVEQDHVAITVPAGKFTFAIRAIIWSAVVEYLDEVSYGIKDRTDTFRFPNEGTIMLIPPKRDYVREKLPRKIVKIVHQDEVHQQHETKEFWTVARAIDMIIKELTEPLHQGKGVAFKLQDDSLEEEQITLFLLVVSELTGVGWSRW